MPGMLCRSDMRQRLWKVGMIDRAACNFSSDLINVARDNATMHEKYVLLDRRTHRSQTQGCFV